MASSKVLVALCRDLSASDKRLFLDELTHWLEEKLPQVRVRLEPDLCKRPHMIKDILALSPSERLVLGLCSTHYTGEFQSYAIMAGLDPFALEVIDLETWCALPQNPSLGTERAKIMLAAAVSKARAYTGSRPENRKLVFIDWEEKVSRRAFFTLPPVRYQPVPSIARDKCTAERGCVFCLNVCPVHAITWQDDLPAINTTACQGCGLCQAACPQDAIDFPGFSSAQLKAQIATLLDRELSDLKNRSIVFGCAKAISQIQAQNLKNVTRDTNWLPVVVPCAGMVSIGVILQSLAGGAKQVSVLPCGSCWPRVEEDLKGRISYCQELLRRIGSSPALVQLASEASLPSIAPVSPAPGLAPAPVREGFKPSPTLLFAPAAAAEAIDILAKIKPSSATLSFEHPYSPFGVITLDPEKCTGCGSCTAHCPTGALASEANDSELSITFDARLCIGCSGCVNVCPEVKAGAIKATTVTDVSLLRKGKSIVYHDEILRCQACGGTIATKRMLRRLAEMVGDEGPAFASTIGRLCPSCRGALSRSQS